MSLTQQEILGCVEAAVRAPSIHNTQPWLFVPEGDRIEVHSDPSRRLPAIDPQGRALNLSLGAAVLNLRLAVSALGRGSYVTLLPTAGDARHVASVTAGSAQRPSVDDLELFHAIPVRRTNRRPFTGTPPPPAALQRLEYAALRQGALLHIADPAERDMLLSLARTADSRQRSAPAYRNELRVWTTDDPYRDDGIPLDAVGPWSRDSALPLRDFALDREIPGRDARSFEPEPTVAMLSMIGHDTPADWLRAGQALQRVLLEATRLGLSTSLFTQPLEQPDLRELLADPTGHTTLQAVLRVGYGPPAPPTPRRSAADVITRNRPLPLRPPVLS